MRNNVMNVYVDLCALGLAKTPSVTDNQLWWLLAKNIWS